MLFTKQNYVIRDIVHETVYSVKDLYNVLTVVKMDDEKDDAIPRGFYNTVL
jgi:hypothetical protein